jgi:hypothetical protein
MSTARDPKLISRLALCGALAAGIAAALPGPAGVAVTAGDITDRRRNDNSFAGLEVELKLAGEAAGGSGARAPFSRRRSTTRDEAS